LNSAPTGENRVIEQFEFEDAGRKFVCSVETLRRSSPEEWWWFRVSAEAQCRYAAFCAEKGDTVKSVQSRVVAYYDQMLARRAAPTVNRWQRRAQRPDVQVNGTAATPVPSATEQTAPPAE
jgi:hypothetical protein